MACHASQVQAGSDRQALGNLRRHGRHFSGVAKAPEHDYPHYGIARLIPQADFLFEAEVKDFLVDAQKKIIRLQALSRDEAAHVPNGDNRVELMMWLGTAHVEAHKLFAPYLTFGKWR